LVEVSSKMGEGTTFTIYLPAEALRARVELKKTGAAINAVGLGISSEIPSGHGSTLYSPAGIRGKVLGGDGNPASSVQAERIFGASPAGVPLHGEGGNGGEAPDINSPAPRAGARGWESHPRRVLLLEDQEMIRSAVVALLQKCNCLVEAFETGEAAVAAYKQNKNFDLVILDMTLPGGMSGLEALQAMRAFDPNVRAVVSTGYADDPVLAEPEKYGFRGVLPKPYSFETLKTLLDDLTHDTVPTNL
jgi:CheY-like chemotaxis protein